MMTDYVATTPGLYPLPDWAKDDLSELKGHQKEDLLTGEEGEDIEAAYEQARGEVLDDQLTAELDRVVEGQLRWDDQLAHPLTIHDAVETGGIVRYYDNNNFYRDPQVVGELDFSGDMAAEFEQAIAHVGNESQVQATLPGPYSLAQLATDQYYNDEAEFLQAITEFLVGELTAFPDHDTVSLLEPSLVTDPPGDGEDAQVTEAIDTVAGATDADVIVQTYWDTLEEKVYAHLMDADIDAVGFDFIAGDREQALYNINEYGTKDSIALGVVDGQNTLVEDAETVTERVSWIDERVPNKEFESVYVTSNTELFYLPVNKYKSKLTALADAVEAL